MTNTEIADRLFAAVLAGDAPTLDALFAPGATLCHNAAAGEMDRETFLPLLAAVPHQVHGARFENVRRAGTPTGFVEQHTLAGETPSGEPVAVHACIIATTSDGQVTRISEYADSAQLARLESQGGAR